MKKSMSRRTFMTTTAAIVAAPAVFTRAATADEPIVLRCSLETVPSHARNVTIRDYFSKIEIAAHGRIKTQLYESGQLFPDLQVGKALLQGQIEMAAPGSWSLTGLIADADFLQLPLLYGGRLTPCTALSTDCRESCSQPRSRRNSARMSSAHGSISDSSTGTARRSR
jgi:TRAP-type C4-dicarboxylate transport system substrate-binding protein